MIKHFQRRWPIYFIITSLCLILMVYTNCGRKRNPSANPYLTAQADLGIKNYEQINESFSSITGVPTSRANDPYNNIKAQMPLSYDIATFQTTHQLHFTNLGARYCTILIDSFRDNLPEIDFSDKANITLDESNWDNIINIFSEKLWLKSMNEFEDESEKRIILKDLIKVLLEDENLDSSGTVRKVLKGLCTTMLSSTIVTTL